MVPQPQLEESRARLDPLPAASVETWLSSEHRDGIADRTLHRSFNVTVAAIGLILCLPLLATCALLVWLTSPGPPLYVQTRIGLDRRNGNPPRPDCRRTCDLGGKPFRLYKLRTMYASDDGAEHQVWASPGDRRVTPVGGLLRKYRVDEIPQFLNVLRGDMNLVGPRPEQPKIFASLREELAEYGRRQAIRPGITGWAQVNHHYDRTTEDVRRKLALDLEYIRRRSILEDLRILLRTVPVVVFRRGAW